MGGGRGGEEGVPSNLNSTKCGIGKVIAQSKAKRSKTKTTKQHHSFICCFELGILGVTFTGEKWRRPKKQFEGRKREKKRENGGITENGGKGKKRERVGGGKWIWCFGVVSRMSMKVIHYSRTLALLINDHRSVGHQI